MQSIGECHFHIQFLQNPHPIFHKLPLSENLLLLLLTIDVLGNKPVRLFKKSPFLIKGMIYFLIVGTLAFSQSLGNIGIMIRMRNMFLPGMLIFILWSIAYRMQLKQKNKFA